MPFKIKPGLILVRENKEGVRITYRVLQIGGSSWYMEIINKTLIEKARGVFGDVFIFPLVVGECNGVIYLERYIIENLEKFGIYKSECESIRVFTGNGFIKALRKWKELGL
jgi:hypothetical protein